MATKILEAKDTHGDTYSIEVHDDDTWGSGNYFITVTDDGIICGAELTAEAAKEFADAIYRALGLVPPGSIHQGVVSPALFPRPEVRGDAEEGGEGVPFPLYLPGNTESVTFTLR